MKGPLIKNDEQAASQNTSLKSIIRPWDLPHINTNTANYIIYYFMQDKLFCRTNFCMFDYNLQPQSVSTMAHASECDETPI